MRPTSPTARALSFGARATAYAAFRPGYPAAAVAAVMNAVEAAGASPVGSPPGCMRILDLAAGTGKLTQSLVGRGAAVIAVEPDEQMLHELQRRLPEVDARLGSAERIPLDPAVTALADCPVRLVTVGQAMHWFDLDSALPEIARVLTPGGVLAALWNDANTDDAFTAGYQQTLERWVSAPRGAAASGDADHRPPFRGRAEFSDPELVRIEWALPLSRQELHGLAGTLSSVIVAEPERVRGLHADLDQLIDTQPDPESLVLQQMCHTWIATRRRPEDAGRTP